MSATAGFAFSCDSPDGCMAHAMAAGDLDTARTLLHEALGWGTSLDGDLCPQHAHQAPVPPVSTGEEQKP